MIDFKHKGLQRRLAVKDYILDDKNVNWDGKLDRMRFFIQMSESYFNDRLQSQGYVFLNDVLNHLGLPPRAIGQIAGWSMDRHSVVEIRVTQTRYLGNDLKEFFLEIKHDGIIVFDVLGD